jgi:transcriptional regulator GlxA family with amidase domain
MESNFHRKLTLTVMARAVQLSTSRLRHLFKAEVGLTPTQYLQRLRMEQAKALLESTYISVKEIAVRVGVGGGSHFVHDFKRAFGVTPSRYRASRLSVLTAEEFSGRDSHFEQRIATSDN